jgi:hypothetical protein
VTSSYSSATAAEYRLTQKQSAPTASTNSSSSSSANAAEQRLRSKPSPSKAIGIESGDTLWEIAEEKFGDGNRWKELRKADGTPFTDRDASHLKVGTQVYLPTAKPKSASPPPVSSSSAADFRLADERSMRPTTRTSNNSGSTSAADFRLAEERSRLNHNLNNSSTTAAEYRIKKNFEANYRPDLKPTPGSAAHFCLEEERSKIRYQQNKTKIDAEVQQIVQKIRQERQQRQRSFSGVEFRRDVGIGVLKAGWDVIKGGGALAKGVYDLSFNPNQEVRAQTREKFGKGVAALAQNPAIQSLSNPITASINFTTRPRETTQAFKDLGAGFVQPYVEAWKSGRPGEAFGRALFDFGSLFVPGGAATKASSATRVAKVGSTVTRETPIVVGGAERTAGRVAVQSEPRPTIEARPNEPAIADEPKPTITPPQTSKPTATTDRSPSVPASRPNTSASAVEPKPTIAPKPDKPEIAVKPSSISTNSALSNQKPLAPKRAAKPTVASRDATGRSKPAELNPRRSSDLTAAIDRGGVWRAPNGQFARNPNRNSLPNVAKTGRYNREFAKNQLDIILRGLDEQGFHPFGEWVDPQTRNFYSRHPEPWSKVERPGVQVMHLESGFALEPGQPERLALGDAFINWWDSRGESQGIIHHRNAVMLPDGLIVEKESARRVLGNQVDELPEIEGWVSPTG